MTSDFSRRSPDVISASANLRSAYLSFDPRNNSINLGADISLDRHFTGLGSLPSDLRLSASITPSFKESDGAIELANFRGNLRDTLWSADFRGNVRAAGAGLELNFNAQFKLLNFIPSTWVWGHLDRKTTDVTAAGLVAAPAGSLFPVTAPLIGLYTTHSTGDRSWNVLAGGLVVPSIEAITKGKSAGEMFPTYGFAKGSLSFSNVNLGLGAGSLRFSAEGAISVNELLNPSSREINFNNEYDIIHGKGEEIPAAYRFNFTASHSF